MNRSISNPNIRKAIYKAFKGKCFYTGRPVEEEDMVIDHLIPKSKNGEDRLSNYVLTFSDLNSGKGAKIDGDLFKMKWVVEQIYAPRARKLLATLENTKATTLKCNFDPNNPISKFRTKTTRPKGLKVIRTQDLFWADDQSFHILSNSDLVTLQNISGLLRGLKKFTKIALGYNDDFCFDVWLTKDYGKQLRSLWYKIDNNYIKIIKKTKLYDNRSPDKWANIYFSSEYLNFLKWRQIVNEYLEKIYEIEDHKEYKKLIMDFCVKFPPPEKYAHEILA